MYECMYVCVRVHVYACMWCRSSKATDDVAQQPPNADGNDGAAPEADADEGGAEQATYDCQ